MRAFIVRPFGEKNGVDFDRVERELIAPALDAVGIGGRTTAEIVEQGNIREDMFQRLLIADLVVADVSIHNANVFYELGIRHALRDKRTVLISARIDQTPFDLQTDRYFRYDRQNPGVRLADLTQALRATLASERVDSPVFALLPRLHSQDPAGFVVLPKDFREAVERAKLGRYREDLRLYAAEITGLDWEVEGLRAVGAAQFDLRAWQDARETFERLNKLTQDADVDANLKLGTIYQKLGRLEDSDVMLQRALDSRNPAIRAEASALVGSNAKAHARAEWRGLAVDEARIKALRSESLRRAVNAYRDGFIADPKSFYAGINALALATLRLQLASILRSVWDESFEDNEGAAYHLKKLAQSTSRLAGAVWFALETGKEELKREQRTDPWFEFTRADFEFLTSDRPQLIASQYRKAFAAARAGFPAGSARDQLELFRGLGVFEERTQAALAEFDAAGVGPAAAPVSAGPCGRVLVFTGHMVDKPDRIPPRFPAAAEPSAHSMIRECVERYARHPDGVAVGLAGGACGGDILFHEICAELGIPTRLYLALPKDQFVAASVGGRAGGWERRFWELCKRIAPRELQPDKDLPRWLHSRDHYDIWRRCNVWLMQAALAEGAERVTVVALWDGQEGDGPGGAKDLFETAARMGAENIRLPAETLAAGVGSTSAAT